MSWIFDKQIEAHARARLPEKERLRDARLGRGADGPDIAGLQMGCRGVERFQTLHFPAQLLEARSVGLIQPYFLPLMAGGEGHVGGAGGGLTRQPDDLLVKISRAFVVRYVERHVSKSRIADLRVHPASSCLFVVRYRPVA